MKALFSKKAQVLTGINKELTFTLRCALRGELNRLEVLRSNGRSVDDRIAATKAAMDTVVNLTCE